MTGVNSTKKRKVMFIIDFIYAKTGGTETQVVELINNINGNNYDLYLVCLRNTHWIERNAVKMNCEVRAFNYNMFNHKDPRNIISFLQITRYIKKIEPDIVITFFKTSYMIGVFAARLAGINNILSTRRDYGLWLDKRIVWLLKWANRYVKRIITNSQRVKELTSEKEQFAISKIDVIYNGINYDKIGRYSKNGSQIKKQLGIALQKKVVGIVANLRPMKKHKTFLAAAKEILKVRPDVDFVLVGGGLLQKELESSACQLGIEKNVHFTGMQEDAIPFLSIFDIGVNCSANEGLSNAVMEYMAYGIPCIVSDAGGNAELIENGINGYLFELENEKELAQKIMGLLENKMRQEEFILKSKEKIINQMSMEKMVDSYDALFRRILENDA